MKVRAVRDSLVGCPSSLKRIGFCDEANVNITISSEREVHAMSVFSGITFFLVLDDADVFCWLPAWLFRVVDARLPREWTAGVFSDDPSLVIGPRFVAEDLGSYKRMVELHPGSVSQMREWIEKGKNA